MRAEDAAEKSGMSVDTDEILKTLQEKVAKPTHLLPELPGRVVHRTTQCQLGPSVGKHVADPLNLPPPGDVPPGERVHVRPVWVLREARAGSSTLNISLRSECDAVSVRSVGRHREQVDRVPVRRRCDCRPVGHLLHRGRHQRHPPGACLLPPPLLPSFCRHPLIIDVRSI